MFGKIIDITENTIIIENTSNKIETNLLNIHVIFSDVSRKVVGEIIKITKEQFTIVLLGEIHDTYFQSGIIKVPAMTSSCRIIYKSELELLIGNQDYASKNQLLIGNSIAYEGYKVTVNMNSFFSNHFAILGNTGTGKSCAVARLIQNIFYYNSEAIPTNAHLILFDIYGEYHNALKKIETIPGIKVRNYTTEVIEDNTEVISIPPYFLDVDDLAILLEVQDSSLLSILEKTLQYVYIFKSTDPEAEEYKNDIIAKCLTDILSSGKNSTQIRDQIVSILMKYNTPTLNLNSEIVQPGYTRTLQQCLNIDAQGKMNAIQFVHDFLSQFNKVELNAKVLGDNFIYDLDDIYYALEFALLSEGTFNSQTMYDKANNLKVRLHAIMNSPLKKYFVVTNPISKNEYVRQMFLTPLNEQAQIVNMNFNFIDDRFAKILTKIFSRLFFQFATNLTDRGSFPIHIILEEAHRYVTKDSDTSILGYNIFDRITKEGRKYGVIMGFITQRPSELSETALSQCSNFISLKLFHPEDLKIMTSIATNVTLKDIEKIKLLRPGTALVFGSAFPLPVITKFDMPDPAPDSSNIAVTKTWF
ncbi:MAG: DUF87 domain-containing protein [Bacilli bacterium]|nr:DUF87 domain-containing protein [Bacilli bacterium]